MAQSCSLLSRCQQHETHPEALCAGAGGVKEAPAPGVGLVSEHLPSFSPLPHLSVLLWAHRVVKAAEFVH